VAKHWGILSYPGEIYVLKHKQTSEGVEKMIEYLKEQMTEIGEVEAKYGHFVFQMALLHLMDVGIRKLSDEEAVEECIANILAVSEVNEDDGATKTPILSPSMQSEILGCAANLAKFTPLALLGYVKANVYLGV